MYTKEQALQQWKAEYRHALRMKSDGDTSVSARVAGPGLAKGREEVPIDEYIEWWRKGIEELEAGADPELYNY